MGYIYLITNDKTGKMYVGQTRLTIQQRWEEHLHTAKNTKKGYLLYQAIRKSGVKHFSIKQLEECDNKKLDEREIYWINKLGTFGNGYNMNGGGNSMLLPSPTDDEVKSWWKRFVNGESLSSISKDTDWGRTTITSHLKKNTFFRKIAKQRMKKTFTDYKYLLNNKSIFEYDKNWVFIKKVNLAKENIRTRDKNQIIDVCEGKRRTYRKHFFRYEKI